MGLLNRKNNEHKKEKPINMCEEPEITDAFDSLQNIRERSSNPSKTFKFI